VPIRVWVREAPYDWKDRIEDILGNFVKKELPEMLGRFLRGFFGI